MIRFLLWLTARLPAREIKGDQGQPYLERYSLCGLFGWRCYIHRFLASDPDRGLHDHPWGRSCSLILSGGYREARFGKRSRRFGRRPVIVRRLIRGQINIIRGDDFHRILLDDGAEAWTLFLHGPRIKGWGFLRNGQYRPFAKTADDYPSAQWWKTAPRGRVLRNCSTQEI